MILSAIRGLVFTPAKQTKKEIKMSTVVVRSEHLKSINSLRDLNPIYRDVASGLKVIPDSAIREPMVQAMRDIVNTVHNKASGVQPPHVVAAEYRKAYVEMMAVKKLVEYHVKRDYPIDMSINIPKGWVIDPKSQEPCNTEIQQVVFHLNTLRDELLLRRNDGSLPPSLEGFIKERVPVLPNRLTDYLVVNGKWDELKAIGLWHYGYSITKPYGKSVYFTLSFDGFSMAIDFQKGFI